MPSSTVNMLQRSGDVVGADLSVWGGWEALLRMQVVRSDLWDAGPHPLSTAGKRTKPGQQGGCWSVLGCVVCGHFPKPFDVRLGVFRARRAGRNAKLDVEFLILII